MRVESILSSEWLMSRIFRPILAEKPIKSLRMQMLAFMQVLTNLPDVHVLKVIFVIVTLCDL